MQSRDCLNTWPQSHPSRRPIWAKSETVKSQRMYSNATVPRSLALPCHLLHEVFRPARVRFSTPTPWRVFCKPYDYFPNSLSYNLNVSGKLFSESGDLLPLWVSAFLLLSFAPFLIFFGVLWLWFKSSRHRMCNIAAMKDFFFKPACQLGLSTLNQTMVA